jgi:surfactin synthase thioesterase subunit
MYPENYTRSPWFAYSQPSDKAKLRLFCFPFAGGGASFYRNWPQDLPEGIEVCPIQLPGRETRMREKAYTRIEPLISDVTTALLPWLDKPYCLFGHSMGSLVVFELARQLASAHNSSPEHIFVSGYNAPQLEYKSALRSDLPENEFMAQLARMEGTPKEVLDSPELMQLLLPLLRADCAVCDFYRYHEQPALACPISVYGGSEDYETPQQSLEAWRVQTDSTFNCHMIQGGHFFLQSARQEFISSLAAELSLILNTLK